MTEPFFSAERVKPVPTDWEVACPTCGHQISCEMEEDDDGSFSKSDRDGDPIVQCESCGCSFIPLSVRISNV